MSAVGDWKVELNDGGWSEVTTDVLSIDSFRGSGQNDGLRRVAEAGEITIRFRNDGAGYDPRDDSLTIGKQIRVSAYNGTGWVYVFTASRIVDINVTYEQFNKYSVTTVTAVDAVASLATKQLAAIEADHDGDTAGERVSRILTAAGISDVTGISALGVVMGDTTYGATALDLIADVTANGEVGAFWVSPTNQCRWVSFSESLSGSPTYTFGDGANLPVVGLRRRDDAQNLVNEIIYSLPAGSVSTSTDATSISTYTDGIRSSLQNLALPHSTQSDADDWATLYLHVAATPEARVAELEVKPLISTALAVAMLAIDIDDRITVTFTPIGAGSAFTQTAWVRGISHAASDGGRVWVTRLVLASTTRFGFFTYDDPTLSVIGGDPVLAPNTTGWDGLGVFTGVAGDLIAVDDVNGVALRMPVPFTDLGAADAAISSPATGQQAFVGARSWKYWNGTQWTRPTG